MGKRGKNSVDVAKSSELKVNTTMIETNQGFQDTIEKNYVTASNTKVSIKKGKRKINSSTKVNEQPSEPDASVTDVKTKKMKFIHTKVLDEDSKLDKLVPQLEKKKQKFKKNKVTSDKPNKKIFFNEHSEDGSYVTSHKANGNSNENKKFLNDEEAEVQDEDIDKFCDEIDEEDNRQYEDWVAQIEAMLHSNKKSSKK